MNFGSLVNYNFLILVKGLSRTLIKVDQDHINHEIKVLTQQPKQMLVNYVLNQTRILRLI